MVRLWAAVSLGKHCAASQKTAAEETIYAINVVQNNTTVLDYDDNWNLLLYKKAFIRFWLAQQKKKTIHILPVEYTSCNYLSS